MHCEGFAPAALRRCLDPYLSVHLRAPTLIARTHPWLGGPLPHQLPNEPQSRPQAPILYEERVLDTNAFQPEVSIGI